jgi:tetratricopeptide (TPR) repeat protein
LLLHARRSRPDWQPSAADASTLAGICAAVGGSPLAIELAAAWLRLLEPPELAAELERTRGVLCALDQDLPPRHRSIALALESSWRLLAPPSSRLLTALGVFCEAFDRGSAEAVAGADLIALGQLVDASMVRRVGARFDLHPLLRQSARERLRRDDALLREVTDRHARVFLDRLHQGIADLEARRRDPAGTVLHLAPEHEDILSAWAHRARQRDASALADAAQPLYRYLDLRNRLPELLSSLCAARDALGDDPDAERMRAALLLLGAGAGLPPERDPAELVGLLPGLPVRLHGATLVHAAITALIRGRCQEGVDWCDQAEAMLKGGAHPFLRGFACAVRGQGRTRLGQPEAARTDLVAAMELASEGRAFGRPFVHLGELELGSGRFEKARQVLEEALAACRAADDRSFATLALGRLGAALHALGLDPRPVWIEAVEEGVMSRMPRVWWSPALVGLAEACLGDGEAPVQREGVVLLAAASTGPSLEAPGRIEDLLERAREVIGYGVWHEACREGRFASDDALLAIVRGA